MPLPSAFTRTIAPVRLIDPIVPATYARPCESAFKGEPYCGTTEVNGRFTFQAIPLPLKPSFETNSDSGGGASGEGDANEDSTYTPPSGSTAIAVTPNPRLFSQTMVLPSDEILVTRNLGGLEREVPGMMERM